MNNLRAKAAIGSVAVMMLLASAAGAATIEDALELAADRLVGGGDPGVPPPVPDLDIPGDVISGLIDAYEAIGKPRYKSCAEALAQRVWPLWIEDPYALLGDRAYALTRLSDVAPDPNNNQWRDGVSGWFGGFEDAADVNQFIDDLIDGYLEGSVSLFYFAHYAMAAEYVDDTYKDVYRSAVIDALADLDEDDDFPVMGLGAAVWALAQTGAGLDGTVIADSGPWAGVTLAELPSLLAGHQVPMGSPFAGSFYWTFDHTGSDLSFEAGYVWETAYGVLGLNAAGGYESEVTMGQQALTVGVDDDGDVCDHICESVACLDASSGEALRALSVAPPADPILLSAKCHKTHGAAGVIDVDLPVVSTCTEVAVEPRLDGANTIVLEFDDAVSLTCANISLTSGTCANLTDLGREMTWQFEINGGAENAYQTISIVGVGVSGINQVEILNVRGDVSGDGVVDVLDMSAVKGALFRPVTADNFRADVNADGVIDVLDMSAVKGNLFRVRPETPHAGPA